MIDRKKIKAYRGAHNITQGIMGKRLGISVTQYSKKEAGKNEFTERETDILCTVMSCDPNFLFTPLVDETSTNGTVLTR